jgi:hypothetical protein
VGQFAKLSTHEVAGKQKRAKKAKELFAAFALFASFASIGLTT